jgi:hypothetical protein
MKHNVVGVNWFWRLSMALLLLVSCSRSVAVGEHFTLWQGETVQVRQTGLAIEIETIAYQQPGSQTPGDGFVELQVSVRGEGETKVTLMAGREAKVGGYEIGLEELVTNVDGEGCELVVTQAAE